MRQQISEIELFNEFKKKISQIFPKEFQVIPEHSGNDFSDFYLILKYRKIQINFIVEAKIINSSASLKYIIEKIQLLKKENKQLKMILLSSYFSPEKQIECKSNGINFVDLSGNLYLAEDNLYIDRAQNKNLFPEKRSGRNPFSDKASLIIRKMISDKNKLWGVRELASSIGVDPGFVSRIAGELEKRHYILKNKSLLKLINCQQIVNDWVDNYNISLNQQLKYFSPVRDIKEILNKIQSLPQNSLPEFALSVQAGANLISDYSVYDVVHIYVNDPECVQQFKMLNISEVEKGPNIIFLLPYYNNSVFFDKQIIKGIPVVSDLQLYLDLYNYPLRGREQAEKIYDLRIKKMLENC